MSIFGCYIVMRFSAIANVYKGELACWMSYKGLLVSYIEGFWKRGIYTWIGALWLIGALMGVRLGYIGSVKDLMKPWDDIKLMSPERGIEKVKVDENKIKRDETCGYWSSGIFHSIIQQFAYLCTWTTNFFFCSLLSFIVSYPS